MKFLQICMDLSWTTSATMGKSHEAVVGRDSVSQRNECQLGQGRSLERPQNKRSARMPSEVGRGLVADNSFIFLLRDHYKMSPALQRIVCYAVALLNNAETTNGNRVPYEGGGGATAARGMTATQRYVASLGRYGNAAFLVPMFGSCEVNQAFCRLCAVHGGVYILREEANAVLVERHGGGTPRCRGVVVKDGRFVKCDWLVVSAEQLPVAHPRAPIVRDLRGVFLMRKPLLRQESHSGQRRAGRPSGCCATAHLPPWTAGIRNVHTVHVLQVDSAANACPDGFYLVHILTSDNGHRHEMMHGACVIRRALRLLLCAAHLGTDERDVAWSAYFHRHVCVPSHASCHSDIACADNVIVCTPPREGLLHFSSLCRAAELAFLAVSPGEGMLVLPFSRRLLSSFSLHVMRCRSLMLFVSPFFFVRFLA